MGRCLLMERHPRKRDIRGQAEGVGVMKDKELKIEET
jgi:hypothetical protein